MLKKTAEYKKSIERVLRAAGNYHRGLDAQVTALAGALRTLAIANQEIDGLEVTTIPVVSRYGNETLAPHPVFKIQKDTQASVTKLMRALGLTVEDLNGTDTTDPLIELTRDVRSATRVADVLKPAVAD